MQFQKLWKNFLLENRSFGPLLEAKIKDVKAKYPILSEAGWISWGQLSINDILGPKGVSKYLMWFAREVDRHIRVDQAGEGRDPGLLEFCERVLDHIMLFNQNQHKLEEKDIYKYHATELETQLDSLGVTASAKAEAEEEEKETAEKNSEIVYNDRGIFAVRPLTTQASCYYGQNPRLTSWCISEKEKRNYFEQYTKEEGKAFIIAYFSGIQEGSDNHLVTLEFDHEGDFVRWHDAPNQERDPDSFYEVILEHLGGMEEDIDQDESYEAIQSEIFEDLMRESKEWILANPPGDPLEAAQFACEEVEREALSDLTNIDVYHDVDRNDYDGTGVIVTYGATMVVSFDITGEEYKKAEKDIQDLDYSGVRHIEREIEDRMHDAGIYGYYDIDIDNSDGDLTIELKVGSDDNDPTVEGFRSFCAFDLSAADKQADDIEELAKAILAQRGYRVFPGQQLTFSGIDEAIQKYFSDKTLLSEAPRDAKVLRKINVDLMKKEIPKEPDEEIRDYFLRLQDLEQQTSRTIGAFPTTLVDWVHGLTDDHFPRDGRKMFAKWLGNAIWHEEAEERSSPGPEFADLSIYNNDIRYIVDYLNGSQDLPRDLWQLSFPQMFERAEEWHETLKGVEVTGEYETKKVVYNFENGFTMVRVPAEDLEVEGEYMGHCVGTYCDTVSSGIKAIYSLRDPKNRPHVTIEVVNSRQDYGTVAQIKGKGNAAPAEKYRPMIKQWLRTTNFAYQESRDYWEILSEDELISDLMAGELGAAAAYNIARTTSNLKIIDYLVSAVTDPDQAFVRKVSPAGPNSGRASLLASLASNRFTNEEQVLSLIGIDLEIKALGRNAEQFFHESHADLGDLQPGGSTLAPVVWDRFEEKLKQDTDEEKLYYMSAIVKYSGSETLGKEVVEYLLAPAVIKSLIKPSEDIHSKPAAPREIKDVYGSIMQDYLLHNQKNADREVLTKIYKFSRTFPGEILVGSHSIESYVANSHSITSDIVGDMLSDKLDPPGLSAKKNLILNPSVEEEHKYGILKKMMHDDTDYSRARGHPIIKQLGRLMWRDKHVVSPTTFEAENREIFSEKFLLWCLDSGVFDGVVDDKLGYNYQGSRPSDSDVSSTREHIKREILDLFREPTEEDFVDEQLKKYFRKPRSKEQFYREIEGDLISEERGRTRQRGIYKFYCMLAYGLTISEDKSRGLDDILADLRALENVTIVTVAIRNQKVAEGRYIAGLAIKFIPSTPGSMRTPENVKARIVRDVKRLTNVHSLFKLSTGLIRLE